MLKLRVITALILGPLILWSVLTFSHQAIAIEIGLILSLAAWEWARLSGIVHQAGRFSYAIFTLGVMLLLSYLIHESSNTIECVLYLSVAWWCLALLIVAYNNRKPVEQESSLSLFTVIRNLLAGLVIFAGAFVAITALHQNASYGAWFILILLILIWVADSAAYFSGKYLGKHKLAVHVSPGKTWEGVAGAMLATVISAFVAGYFLQLSIELIFGFTLIAVLSVAISIVGDLLESLYKRRAGIKDSSQLLPGHGGIMDRIDSLVAAAPVFLFGLQLVGIK